MHLWTVSLLLTVTIYSCVIAFELDFINNGQNFAEDLSVVSRSGGVADRPSLPRRLIQPPPLKRSPKNGLRNRLIQPPPLKRTPPSSVEYFDIVYDDNLNRFLDYLMQYRMQDI